MSGVSIATGVIATDALGGGVGRGLQSPGVLAQTGSPSSVTGTTSETVLATILLPAGAMGPNGKLRIYALYSAGAVNANTKTVSLKIGGTTIVSGTGNLASNQTLYLVYEVSNRNSLSSQVFRTNPQVGPAGPGGAGTLGTSSIDMSIAQNIMLSATLGNASDTVTLESYTVEILNP